MKTLKKVLTIISCLCFSLAISLNVFGASASTVGGVTVKSFTMENGAWIRVDEESGNGIKFNAFLDTETYDTLEGLENATVNYGMVIVPNDMLPAGGMTVDMLKDTVNNHFTNEENCACGKTHYAIVEYETLPNNPDAENKILRGSIVDIKTGNVIRPYTAVAYIEYVGDTTEYYLASYANGDIANSTRSMAYVAQMAIKDGKDTDGSIEATYVTPYTTGDYANKFPYTVNHYINGADQAPVTEKLYGTLGETVTAKHILDSTIEDAETKYAQYRLYGIPADTETTATLYADGKTVFNIVYEKLDTSLHAISDDTTTLLLGSNQNLPGTGAYATYLANTSEDADFPGSEDKDSVVKIHTTNASEYYAGMFRLAFDAQSFELAKANNASYIKFHMYIVVDDYFSTINLRSWEKDVATKIAVGQWTDVIIPISKLNQNRTWVTDSVKDANIDHTKYTQSYIYSQITSKYTKINSNIDQNQFLSCWDITTGKLNKGTISTTDVTYYIDEISWGIDFDAPEITVADIPEKIETSEFTEPTVTVTDAMSWQKRLDNTVTKTLYKINGDTRTEVVLTDGKATLEEGDYVYVVTAHDGIGYDVIGNVATKEDYFTVQYKQAYVVSFDSADAINYVSASTGKNYQFNAEHLDANALASEGLNTNDVVPSGGALKITTTTQSESGYGGWVVVNLGDKLSEIDGALSVTIKLAIDLSKYYTDKEYNGYLFEQHTSATYLTGFSDATWFEFTLNLESLIKDSNTYFDGTNAIFWVGTTTYKNATITYYLESMTFNFI